MNAPYTNWSEKIEDALKIVFEAELPMHLRAHLAFDFDELDEDAFVTIVVPACVEFSQIAGGAEVTAEVATWSNRDVTRTQHGENAGAVSDILHNEDLQNEVNALADGVRVNLIERGDVRRAVADGMRVTTIEITLTVYGE